jgi:ribonuclease P protein component
LSALQHAAIGSIKIGKILAVSSAAPGGDSNVSVGSSGEKRRFPRTARLLRHADFESVYKRGRRHFSASMTVFYLQRSGPETPVSKVPAAGLRIGFTVGRALGGAVQRNRMKRRLREAVRLTRPAAAPDVDVVINPKKSLLTSDFSAVLNEVSRAFIVIEQKLGDKQTGARYPASGARKPDADSQT